MLIAPSLANVAIAFGPAEYFSLMVLGLVVLTFLTQGSMAKALLMACIGIVLGLIGLDSITAMPRLTFGRLELIDGIGLVPVVMGLFGVAEVLINTEQLIKRDVINAKITQLLPNKADWKASAGPIGRGTVLGFFLGILPGRRRRDLVVRVLCAGEAACRRRRNGSARARSRASRVPKPPTTLPRAARSFR